MSKGVTHEEAQSRLGDLLYLQISGRDPVDEMPGVVAHLETCEDCRAILRALQNAQRSLRGNLPEKDQRYRVETTHQADGSWRVVLLISPAMLLSPDSNRDDKTRSIRPIQSGGRLLLFTTVDLAGDTCQVMLVLHEQPNGYMITADMMIDGAPHGLTAHLHIGGEDHTCPVEEGQARFVLSSLSTEDDLRFELRIQQ